MRGTLPLLAAGALAACTPGAPSPADEGDAQAIPAQGAVYADLHLEYFRQGKPSWREGYLQRAAVCDEAGMAGSRLSDEEVARLSTGRLQVWVTPTRNAVRLEIFRSESGTYEEGTQCNFWARTDGAHVYVDRDAVSTLDLRTGESGTTPNPPAHLWRRYRVHDDDIQGGTPTSRNGLPCIEYPLLYPLVSSAGGTVCIWSGGGDAGFLRSGTEISEVGPPTHLRDSLVIDQTPDDNGSGIRVTLRELIESADIPEAEMRPVPANTR